MNINQMMKQAQQMQERLQQQMGETRVEATAGGGMVTVVMNGNKQVEKITHRSRRRVERRCRDAAGSDRRGAAPTRIARPKRPCKKQVGGMLGGLKILQGSVSPTLAIGPSMAPNALPEPLTQTRSPNCSALPGIGAKSAQRLAFHILQDAARGRRTPDGRDPRRQGRVAHCSICSNITDADPCAYCTSADRAAAASSASSKSPHNVDGDREDARIPRRLSRADGRAVAAAGRRPRRSEDLEPARARGARAACRRSSSRRIRTWRVKRRRSIWRSC